MHATGEVEMLHITPLFEDMLEQYPARYQDILGEQQITNTMADAIQCLMIQGKLYTGSDGSEKEEIGDHAYGFTSGIIEGDVWGGAAITPGGVNEMAFLRSEHTGEIGILLVLYALQVRHGSSLLHVTKCIDNVEVLDRAKNNEVGENIKQHLVLDYDLWQAMDSLQALIHTPLKWEKVDSHIEGEVYKEGTSPKGDQYSIHLNMVVDKWAGVARKSNVGGCKQYFYPDSGVMVQLPDKGYIYGDICKWATEKINHHAMIKYLLGTNKHWTEGIFEPIDCKVVDVCMTKMAKKSGSVMTNTLKLVHGWQNDG